MNLRRSKGLNLILKVSVELISEKGYSGTSMRDIAEKAGLQPGSLYAHIDSKEDILAEIVLSGLEEFLKVKKIIESCDASPEEKLRKAINLHLGVALNDRARSLVAIHQWRYLNEPKRSLADKKRRDYVQMFTDILDEGARCMVRNRSLNKGYNTKVQALMILGALNWTMEWYSRGGSDSQEQIGENLADMVLHGLAH